MMKTPLRTYTGKRHAGNPRAFNSHIPLLAVPHRDGTPGYAPNYAQRAKPTAEKYVRRLRDKSIIFLAREVLRLNRRLGRTLGVTELRVQMVALFTARLAIVRAEVHRRITKPVKNLQSPQQA